MKTESEKREYSRGYQRGTARMRDYALRAFHIARGYRDKNAATQREKFGKDNWMSRECSTCERWTRGHPGEVKWGQCSADFLAEVGEPMMWLENKGPLYTHENFGCCNHLSDNPLRPSLTATHGDEK